ncbi:MAG: hypothetical protein MZV63_13195 [Marinilabiliales bacterium]|nr:hypothetical protein [Marinilabiliales bacterium]
MERPSKVIRQPGIMLRNPGKVSRVTSLGSLFVYAARKAGIITSWGCGSVTVGITGSTSRCILALVVIPVFIQPVVIKPM